MLFREIIGHAAVKERLIQSVKASRISHALLFAGPPGSGTLPLALAYSQFINCESRMEEDSCGACASCIKMNKMIHPDVHFSFPVAGPNKPKSVDFIVPWREAVSQNPYLEVQNWYEYLEIENKQGIISVEESSDLLRKLSLKSFESEFKTSIIWLPEKLRSEAANALLKIIEEPPAKTLFLLVTENAELILPTILSRTQLIKTGRIPDREMVDALMHLHGKTEEEARHITQLCDGNYNQVIKLTGEESTEQQSEKDFIEWMRICYKLPEKYDYLLVKMDRFARLTREEQKAFMSFALAVLRECMFIGMDMVMLQRFGEKGYEQLHKFAALIHENNVHRFEEELNNAFFHVERNANAKILFLDLSFKIQKILHIKKPELESSGI